MFDESAHLPAWVRRQDGSQEPFDADRISQSLFAAAESLGSPNAFLARELTDAVVHFLGQESWSSPPTTATIAEHVEKVVREVGHPSLARRYAELRARRAIAEPGPRRLMISFTPGGPGYLEDCLTAYAREATFSRDVAAAMQEGLLSVRGSIAPNSLARLLVKSPRFTEQPWWLALDDWRTCGGDRWIVESPEWLCGHHMHPAMTPILCERLLSLPTIAERAVELHLNVHEPPTWSAGALNSPLFLASDEEPAQQERSNFLDGLLERWRTLDAPRLPILAWHVHERTFEDDTERRQLETLLSLAIQGKPVQFHFDRPRQLIAYGGGVDRKTPGLLLELGVDLVALANRPEIANDGAILLKKLPCLARMAVSAAAQKRQALRALPDSSPLKQRFLIDRSASLIVPTGVETVVHTITGATMTQSRLSHDLAIRLVQTLRSALHAAGAGVNLDMRLECPAFSREAGTLANAFTNVVADARVDGAGVLSLDSMGENSVSAIDLVRRCHEQSAITRLSLQRSTVQQGELAIA